MKLSEGTTLQGGKYCIEKCLGQGGFGITYLAEWKQRKAKVAIKEFFIRELCCRDEQFSQMTVLSEGGRRTVEHFRKKFLREAETIFNLNHPNIIRIFDVFEENGTAYYVMEYHANGSLADKLKTMNGAPLPETDALRYTKQVADALAYIHEQKMPAIENEEVKKRSLRHLDIKPGNIMLNNDGNAILIDFGLVKVYDEKGNPLNTASSTLNGFSPGFAPLEQMQGSSSSIFTPATDIYALG
ncbi:MAG: serine/threonine protein kinase, partial [Bacteroidaceae bacterium]|nr:serine/threonine protein kinase [Bacteroidaceae bacterium]